MFYILKFISGYNEHTKISQQLSLPRLSFCLHVPPHTCKYLFLSEDIHFLNYLCLYKKATTQQHVPAMTLAHQYQLEVYLCDCYEDLRPVEKIFSLLSLIA